MRNLLVVLILFLSISTCFSAEKTQPTFELTLSVNDKAIGVDYDTVYVTLKNISDTPQYFINPESSWGWDALTFQVTIDGKTIKLSKFQIDWHKNTPGPRTLQPGESYIFAEHLLSWPWHGWPQENLVGIKLQTFYDAENLEWAKIKPIHLISNSQIINVNLQNYCPPSTYGTLRKNDGSCSDMSGFFTEKNFTCDEKHNCIAN